jgi:polyisoprenoid-binding protein YceI
LFNVMHADASRFWGRFDAFKGQVVVDAAKPDASSVVVEVSAESVDHGQPGPRQPPARPDFFNSKEFPDIASRARRSRRRPRASRFPASSRCSCVDQAGQRGRRVHRLPRERRRTGKRTGYEVRFTIKRSDFRP